MDSSSLLTTFQLHLLLQVFVYVFIYIPVFKVFQQFTNYEFREEAFALPQNIVGKI